MSDLLPTGGRQGADPDVLSTRSGGPGGAAVPGLAVGDLDDLLARISTVLLRLAAVERAEREGGFGSEAGLDGLVELTTALEREVVAMVDAIDVEAVVVDAAELARVRSHLVVAGDGVRRLLDLTADAAAA